MRGLARSGLIAGIAMLAASVAAPPAGASSVGFDFVAAPTVSLSSGWNMGYEFTANQTVSLIGLGAFDELPQAGTCANPSPCNLATLEQHVGLWDIGPITSNHADDFANTADDFLVADAYVNGGSTQIGLFAYTLLGSSVTLQAGHTYVVGSQGGGPFAEFTTFSTDPDIDFVQPVGSFPGVPPTCPTDPTVLCEPTILDDNFIAGNILLDVPEPMSLSLFGAALAGFGVLRRRKRRA